MPVGNLVSLARNPATHSGAVRMGGQRLLANRDGALRMWYIGQAAEAGANKHGRPSGAEPPNCWVMPPKGGGLACFNGIAGDGELAAAMQLGKDLSTALVGSGDITTASLALIVSFSADLAGSSDLSAEMRGAVQMAATLAGSGDLSAALGVIAWCTATLSGEGSLDDSNLTGLAHMAAEILSYGELTPEGLRDAVWKATAASFNDAGTMGAKLNSAASGGVDLNALADAVWDHADAVAVTNKLALLEKILRNKSVTDPATGEFVLYDDDGTTELFRVPLWEDAAGTQAYRGQGAERKERLE